MRVYRKRADEALSHVEEVDSSKITVPYVDYCGFESAFLMKKGKVKKDCPGIWQSDGPGSVFYSCPYCSGINKVETVWRHYTRATREADSVWCVKCVRHLRFYYEK